MNQKMVAVLNKAPQAFSTMTMPQAVTVGSGALVVCVLIYGVAQVVKTAIQRGMTTDIAIKGVSFRFTPATEAMPS